MGFKKYWIVLLFVGFLISCSSTSSNDGLEGVEGENDFRNGGDAARLLKKLADPNDTTPIIKIIDDLMVANKTVGRNVYLKLRNHLDTFVDSTGKSLRDKLDEISANSKQMIQDGSTVDEAAEYFETEMKRILDDSTADEELISAITKYEKDINRDWFPTPLTLHTTF